MIFSLFLEQDEHDFGYGLVRNITEIDISVLNGFEIAPLKNMHMLLSFVHRDTFRQMNQQQADCHLSHHLFFLAREQCTGDLVTCSQECLFCV